jgi:predicted unusual protein kinase regulating ubiquinone biosynthesis (AarF/ABC1/UbiB family)
MPKEFTNELKVLQDSATQLPFEDIKVTYESDHNCQLEDVFSEFSEKAIGAASLAQVHRATLKSTGQKVVVKIQYPTLRAQYKVDLFIIKKLVKVSNWFCDKYDY